MKITGKITGTGCEDGSCPNIWATDDPEFVAVQGETITDPAALAGHGLLDPGESLIVVPRVLLRGYREDG